MAYGAVTPYALTPYRLSNTPRPGPTWLTAATTTMRLFSVVVVNVCDAPLVSQMANYPNADIARATQTAKVLVIELFYIEL